jgi:hypothetical protein
MEWKFQSQNKFFMTAPSPQVNHENPDNFPFPLMGEGWGEGD